MSTFLHRLEFGSLGSWAAIVAFLLTFGVFLFACWRALNMRPTKRDHMSHLPLEADQAPRTPH